MSEDEILDEYYDREKVDFAAVYPFAAEMGRQTKPTEPAVEEHLSLRLFHSGRRDGGKGWIIETAFVL